MEKEHKDLINRNFEYLVNNCKSDLILSRLKTKIPITSEEYEELHIIQDKKAQCRQLLKFLINRGPNVFDAIINSLIETKQFSVLQRLRPEVVTDTCVAAQTRDQQRSNKVFLEPQNYYDVTSINIVNVTSQDDPLDVVVTLSTNFDYEKREYEMGTPFYNTTSKNRGLVKIINIVEVEGKKYREGSDVDVRNLTNLFTQMGFIVDVHDTIAKRPTRMNIIKAVEEFVTDQRLMTADIAMFFIMSHGGHVDGKDFIDDCEGFPVYLREIEAYFFNDRCKYMQNKPKIIFVQACRGELSDYGVRRRVETDSHVVHLTPTEPVAVVPYMPTQSDILLAFSTCAGAASHRDTKMGTWFIYLVCEVFMNHAHDKDVDTMLKIVYEKLKHERTIDGEMQTGETTQRTFKKCYLNPGIYREDNNICYF